MPMLLEDLAEETKANNQRLADRLDAEARELEDLQPVMAVLEDLRDRVVESARQGTDQVISRVSGCEGIWRATLAELRKKPAVDVAERHLHSLFDALESGRKLVQSSRRLWKIAEQLGATPERLEELDQAEKWFQTRVEDAKLALEHRSSEWRPADPDRLALGLQLAREGRTVTADEARSRFRRPQG